MLKLLKNDYDEFIFRHNLEEIVFAEIGNIKLTKVPKICEIEIPGSVPCALTDSEDEIKVQKKPKKRKIKKKSTLLAE